MVNRPLIVKWVDALRSGKYHQIRGFLRTPEGFDVLGVLCDIVEPAGWLLDKPYKSQSGVYYGYTYHNCSSTYMLPTSLIDYLGVEDNFSYYFVEMNDKKAMDFNQIAAYLEATYLVN